MKKLFFFLIMVSKGFSQMAVADAGTQGLLTNVIFGQNAQLAKLAEEVVNSTQTLAKATETVKQVTDLTKFIGDPAALADAIGLGQIAGSLQQSGVLKLASALQDAYSTSQSLKGSIEGLYGEISNVTSLGNAVDYPEQLFKRWATTEGAYDQYKTTYEKNNSTIDELRRQLSQLASKKSSTQAEAQQVANQMEVINGEISRLGTQTKEASDQVLVQNAMNENQKAKEDAANALQEDADMKKGVLRDVKSTSYQQQKFKGYTQ